MRTQIVFIYSIFESLKKAIFLDKYQSQKFSALGAPRQRPPCAGCLLRKAPSSSPPVIGIFHRFRSKYTNNPEPLGLRQSHQRQARRGEPIPNRQAFRLTQPHRFAMSSQSLAIGLADSGTLAYTPSPLAKRPAGARRPAG